MQNSIVLGLGFGDEGKGLITSYLVSQSSKPLVIRFSGGQQAGHTVVNEKGHRHVFSTFGSGTLQGAPTYWSKYCTFCPLSVLEEYKALAPYRPILYIDRLCPVTTPYDVRANIRHDKSNGTVGVGVGPTMQRQEDFYKLYFQDILFPKVLRAKMENIKSYYSMKGISVFDEKIENEINGFLRRCEDFRSKDFWDIADGIPEGNYDHQVFEGSQGILLDMDWGFFPNVTRSNTTSKNAFELLKGIHAEVFYVTRTYQTRHGNGFMSNETRLALKNNEHETNVQHEHQGIFRTGFLDTELLKYALLCDDNYSGNNKKRMVVTCADQTGGFVPTENGGEPILKVVSDLIMTPHQTLISTGDTFQHVSDKHYQL